MSQLGSISHLFRGQFLQSVFWDYRNLSNKIDSELAIPADEVEHK